MADNTESCLKVEDAGDQYADQTKSPLDAEIDLPNVDKMLTGPEVWPEWAQSARSILQMNSLDGFISNNATRPDKHASISNRWKRRSMIVAAWLLANVSESIQNRMMMFHVSDKFADEVWDSLQAMNTGCIYHHIELWKDFISIEASNYSKVEEFTKAYESSYRKARDHGLPLEPYVALTSYLAQIQVSHPEVAGKIMDQLYMNEREPSQFNSEMVHSILCDIQDHLSTERWSSKRARKYGPNAWRI